MKYDINQTIAIRHSKIEQLLNEKKQLNVKELCEIFKVSSVTIRKDLAYLESKKRLIRTRGGAMKNTKMALELELSERAIKNLDNKVKIGATAAKLVEDGDSIILDSGTTTIEIAKRLYNISNLTIITDALNIILELAGLKNIKLISPGGTLHSTSFTFLGSFAENNLHNYYCDKYFLGAYGVDTLAGVYTPNVQEASINRIMGQISREIILVVDSSKFRKKSLCFIMPITKIHKIITDSGISEEDKVNIKNLNIDLIIV